MADKKSGSERMIAPRTARKLVTPRAVDEKGINAAETPYDRVIEVNKAIQNIHFAHNEVRRLLPKFVQAVTDLVTEAKGQDDVPADADVENA